MTDRVRLDQHCCLQCQLLLLFDVITDVAKLLLHHPHRLKVRRVVEGITSQQKQLVDRQHGVDLVVIIIMEYIDINITFCKTKRKNV